VGILTSAPKESEGRKEARERGSIGGRKRRKGKDTRNLQKTSLLNCSHERKRTLPEPKRGGGKKKRKGGRDRHPKNGNKEGKGGRGQREKVEREGGGGKCRISCFNNLMARRRGGSLKSKEVARAPCQGNLK